MIENRKIQNYLKIVIFIIILLEIIISYFKEKVFIIDIIYNILLGIIGSSIVSYIIARITYNQYKEEKNEELIKNLLEIYSKMIMFKCSYNESKNKNEKIIELQKALESFIPKIYDIEYDFVYKLNEINEKETIVLNKYNDKAVKRISEEVEFRNNKLMNNAKGLKNQKEFVESYNKMLNKVRMYLERFVMQKYKIQYKFLKEIDSKYEDIKSNSNKKIEYTK